jgi:hypothetical protein
MHFLLARRCAAFGLLTMSMVSAATPSGQPVIEVFLPVMLGPGLDMALLRARDIVTKTYEEIGVKVVWSNARPTPGCEIRPLHGKILVTLAKSNPSLRNDMALAYANPYLVGGPCVTLLMDRLADDVRLNPFITGFVLGHTLAHEIGHVLQGVARHSETGVMKSRWSQSEMKDMTINRLHFEACDRELILEALGAGQPLPTLFTRR